MLTASACKQAWISIDTVTVGGTQGTDTLRQLSAATVNGHHHNAETLAALTAAITQRGFQVHRRQAATVICVDVSGSMTQQMPGESHISRIAACAKALEQLVSFKRTAFGGYGQ